MWNFYSLGNETDRELEREAKYCSPRPQDICEGGGGGVKMKIFCLKSREERIEYIV